MALAWGSPARLARRAQAGHTEPASCCAAALHILSPAHQSSVPRALPCSLSWPLAVALLVSAPLLTPLIAQLSRRIGAASKASQAASNDVSAAADEVVENMRVVKLFAQQTRELRRFQGLLDGAHALAVQVGARAGQGASLGSPAWRGSCGQGQLRAAVRGALRCPCATLAALARPVAGAEPAGAAGCIEPHEEHAVRACLAARLPACRWLCRALSAPHVPSHPCLRAPRDCTPAPPHTCSCWHLFAFPV